MSAPAHGRVALVTLGCAKNIADSDLLAGQLLREGIGVIGDPSDADAIIVNTCAFLTASEQESVDMILEMAEHKRSRAGRRLVVVGCLAQRHGASLLQEIPEIDWIVGPGEVHALAPRLSGWIREGKQTGSERVHLGGMESVEENWDIRVISNAQHTAYVKISEGCDRTCSFCVIPRLRGGHRSRSRESIVAEVEKLAASGVREVNLVAQELTAYGIDRYGQPSLAQLLHDLDRIEGVAWIRLLYTYPSNWPDELVAAIRDLPRVCPYVDMPIQHVADPVLRAMRRPPFDRTRRLLERLRDEIPALSVRTTLIAGFPGETERDFEEMLAFVASYGFDALGVFRYSREQGTDAAELPDQIDEKLGEARRKRLLSAQREVARRKGRARVGAVLPVLLERQEGDRTWIGRHAGQAPEVDGCVRVRGLPVHPGSAGRFLAAKITGAGVYDLEARPAAGSDGEGRSGG